jgi:hypothetical protein
LTIEPPVAGTPQPEPGPRTGWSKRRKVVVGTVGVVIALTAIGSLAGDPDQGAATPSGSPTQAASATSTPASTAETSASAEVSSPPEPIVYTLSIAGTPQDSSGLAVAGETNLPDGAVVEILASRAFHNQGEDDIRSTDVGGQAVTVTGGRFEATLTLDESNLLLNVGTGAGEDVIDQVDQDLTACAQFQTGLDIDGQPRQPSSVSEIVGANGEALATSPMGTVFGSATDQPSNWLEVLNDVGLPSPLIDDIADRQGSVPEQVPLDGFCV